MKVIWLCFKQKLEMMILSSLIKPDGKVVSIITSQAKIYLIYGGAADGMKMPLWLLKTNTH